MTGNAMPRFLLGVLAAVGVTALVVGVVHLAMPQRDAVQLTAGSALPEPRPIAEFTLLDQHGEAITRSAFEGQWSLLFAGFTHCPDICPATLAQLRRLDEQLADRDPPLQTVFLSVDPERDTPERLGEYIGHFSPDFLGITGDKAGIDALSSSLGLAYVRVPQAQERYTVDHSTAVVLIDPQGRVAAYFRQPLDLDAMARDLTAMLAL